ITVLCGFGFIWSQIQQSNALIEISIFRNKRFVMVLAISFLFGFGNFATVYAFPIFGQIVQNFSPTIAGSMLLPGSLFAALVLPLTGMFADKSSPKLAMVIGVVIIAFSVWMLAGADSNTVFWYVAFSLLLGRVGSAFVSPSVNTTALGELAPEQVRRGAGVANLSLMLGGSTGISVYVLLLERRIEFHAVNLGSTQTASNSSTIEMISALSGPLGLAGVETHIRDGIAFSYLDRVVIGQANMLGFQDGFVALTLIALMPLIPILLLILSSRNSRPH
ncbi:MAG: MFS transporter, partial [Flavobacteriaceae bacterium]